MSLIGNSGLETQAGGERSDIRRTFLGRGSAVDAWLVETRTGPVKTYVSKRIRLDPESLPQQHDMENDQDGNNVSFNGLRKDFIQELSSKVRRWSMIRHKNVIQVFGSQDVLELRVEYCVNGTASQYLAKHDSDSVWRKLKMIHDVLQGMEYLHTQDPPVIHGCLNMGKLFVDDHGTTKIGEFGLSALTRRFALFVPSISQAGLSRWMSPELVNLGPDDTGGQPTTASDVWALGCVLFEIVTGKLPYSEQRHELRVRKEIISGRRPGESTSITNPNDYDIWPAIDGCWTLVPEFRPPVKLIRQLVLRRMPAGADASLLSSSAGSEQWQFGDPQIPSPEVNVSSPYASVTLSSPSIAGVPAAHGDNIWSQLNLTGGRGPLSIGGSSSIGTGGRSIWSHLGANSQGGTTTSVSSGPSVPPTTSLSERRPTKRRHQSETDEGEDEDSGDEVQGQIVVARVNRQGPRVPGGCSNCKRLKMKCVFEDAEICQRCKHTNKQCVVEGRKPRSGPNKRELLMRELASKDQLIDSLLRQIHNPAMRAPINWPPSVPVPQPANAQERPPDKDVLAWIESIRQNRPPTPTGSMDTSSAHQRTYSESLPAQPEPGDDAVSFGESASNIKYTNDERPRTPAELRQDSVEVDDKLHSIPPSFAPVGLIAKLSLITGREKLGIEAGATADLEEEDKWVGIANATYFEAGPSADPELRRLIIERQMPPEILTHGIIKPAEVDVLFKIFFEQLNPFAAILDPHMHTPAFVFGRCPFLFTTICAISSRYYFKRPELYVIAMHFARQSAAAAMFDRWTSVEVVQGYILMSMYPTPARRWEEDRTWLYMGIAIRMATNLNLHIPWQGQATGEAHEREILNRTRTWLICFNLDRSGATQFGRPPTIREDYIIRKSQDWYKRSNFNLPLDVHLTAYTRLLRIVARFLAQVYSDSNTPSALNKNLDFLTQCTTADKELVEFERETKEQFEKESDHSDSASEYRCNLLPFLSNYSRLVIYSFGHQQAFQRGLDQGKIFFDKCYKAASEVVRIATDILAPSGRLKYAPDGHFVFISFAAAFLLTMLRPQFAAACEAAQSTRIIQLVTRLTEVLASNEVAIDDRHSPRLYSRFLSRLIVKHNTHPDMVLGKLGVSGAGGIGAAGPPGSGAAGGNRAFDKPVDTNQTAGNRTTSIAGPSQSAAATDAWIVHESPPSAPVPLPSKESNQQGRVSSPIARMRSPSIVIRPPTIEQGMHGTGQDGFTSPPATHGQIPSGNQLNYLMGGYTTLEPSGDSLPSMASMTQGETTITDASDADMDYADDSHAMLAAMHAVQDPTWWNSSLLPGFNANFADDSSNPSNEMRTWYATHGNLSTGAANGVPMGMGMQMNDVPNLFASDSTDADHSELDRVYKMDGYGSR